MNEDVSFREHFESLLCAFEKLQDERWKGLDDYHEMVDQARKMAVLDIGRRLDEMNQFREQISEERNVFMTKDLFYTKHDELTKRIDTLDRAKSNLEGRMWAFGIVSTIVTIVNLFIRFFFK